MNGTPRPRGPGSFPATPQTNGARSPNASTPTRPNVAMPLPEVPQLHPTGAAGPKIPTDIVDAPTQRFYVFALYVALLSWKLYSGYTLAIDEDESLWQFLKYSSIDAVFIYCVPLLQIPWLEWSNAASLLLTAVHLGLNGMLMFRIGIPVQAWLISLVSLIWDSELAITEHKVSPGSVLHNASLILGKQIIHILPEGSAVLNPDGLPFCLDSSTTHLDIPLRINQTEPIEIQLMRMDPETNSNETVTLVKKHINPLLKKARKAAKTADPADPLTLRITVTRTGVYTLQKVVDHSKLEVRPRRSEAIVVSCPKAQVRPTGDDRCRNDLSNVALEVQGTPPLTIKYRTTVNDHPREASVFENLQPDDFVSPLGKHSPRALVATGRADVSWARSYKIVVPLNETLASSGVWTYAIEEIKDALGNFVNYIALEEEERPKSKASGVRQSFSVHERPRITLDGCTMQNPLQVPRGSVSRLPIRYGSSGKGALNSPHHVEYLFTPQSDLLPDGHHSKDAELKKQTVKSAREQPQISASGLYTLKSVATDFCGGEVLEPASCLLQNPPEPALTLASENIVDKCAGNPIGLRVGMDLVGSPPFIVRYTSQRKGERAKTHFTEVEGLRGTLELNPQHAGHYTYRFETIKDWVYKEDRQLHNLVLEQDVKPSASAWFVDSDRPKQACIDDSVEYDVHLQGEGPWALEYEIIHNGKRTKYSVSVEDEDYTIKTPALKNGGEYTISLASVTDKMGCKELLKDHVKVSVRHERPKAYFGHIEGKQAVMALEGKSVDLPLRLTGVGPWTLEYENLDTSEVIRTGIRSANDKLNIKNAGTYELLSVRDSVCPGSIDEKSNQFKVNWIARPKISVAETDTMSFDGKKYIKDEMCEGQEDYFGVQFSGNAPFDFSWERHFKDKKGKPATMPKQEKRSLTSGYDIKADTAQAGTYEYKFVSLADAKYDHSSKHFSPVIVQQTVNPLPDAHFNNPGKTYSYCSQESDGEEVIPITLQGVPPFYLEVDIKHHGTPKPETIPINKITTNKYDLRLEHSRLHLGHSSVTIRKIRDARGCTRKPAPGGPRVQISVHDAPSATPLEDRTDFCVGERLSFALGGQVPFTVYYTFENQPRKASNAGTTFRRLAELPGSFTITGLRDSSSECMAPLNLTKEIHPIPTVRLSGGHVTEVDIHEGGGTDLEFDFTGTPPFEFTYTRSTNAQRGRKSKVLEIRTEVSYDYHMSIPVQEDGTYEVVSIKDRWCSFAKPVEGLDGKGVGGQKLLQY